MPLRKLRLLASDDVVEACLQQLRAEMSIPAGFSPEVMAEVSRLEPSIPERDLTDIPFVTIDPPGSMDLDQALYLEEVRGGYRVLYAIADVGGFVEPGGAIDLEAHERGQTLYGADLRTPLYPEQLSEFGASLLPDRDRPAQVWDITLDQQGEIVDGRVERAMVRSRDQLSYEDAQRQLDSGSGSPSLTLLPEIGRLRQLVEEDRGAVTLNIPEQQIVRDDGGWDLAYRMPLPIEGWNAQLSLLTGICAAQLMVDAGVGILRTLPPSDPERLQRLRRIAQGLHIAWPPDRAYPEMVRSLDGRLPAHAALLAEATSLFAGAGYQSLGGGVPAEPHSALATVYTHATAPLRRLVDRYAGETCLAIVAGNEVPDWVSAAIPSLPELMARSATRAGQYEAATVNLIEAALLVDRVGDVFPGVVVELDDHRPRGEVQLRNPAVLAIIEGKDLDLGEELMVKVVEASVMERRVRFEQA